MSNHVVSFLLSRPRCRWHRVLSRLLSCPEPGRQVLQQQQGQAAHTKLPLSGCQLALILPANGDPKGIAVHAGGGHPVWPCHYNVLLSCLLKKVQSVCMHIHNFRAECLGNVLAKSFMRPLCKETLLKRFIAFLGPSCGLNG